jgi:integrase
MKPTHDPRTTPFIEKLADVKRIFVDLPSPLNVAYAIGALAGLRTGEVFALKWEHVDLVARRIHVRESVTGPLKDKDSRIVPILDSLAPILAKWKLETGGTGRVIPPLRRDGEKIDKATPGKVLRRTLGRLGLTRPDLGWYEATRHTFASQWVMAGGSIEKLKEILGHYSVIITERYAHLKPELFTARDLGTITLDLSQGAATPITRAELATAAR